MTERRLESLVGLRGCLLAIVGAMVVVWSAFLLVSPPVFGKAPTGDFAWFSECPRFTVGVEVCLASRVTSGEVRIGRTVVPVSKTLVLQGGTVLTENPFSQTFVGALDGQTLSRVPLVVPGGLLGIVAPGSLPRSLQQLFAQAVNSGATVVTATTELVGVPVIDESNLENKEGTALLLPARIKLDNAFLGNGCYLGSTGSPLVFNLTTGTTTPPAPNKPISGKFGRVSAKDEFELLEITGDSLVDNSFPVPRVTGCGGSFSSVLDPAINAKLGLPSEPGNNTVILHDTLQEATTVGVIASEE